MNALRLEPTARDDDNWIEIVAIAEPMEEDSAGDFKESSSKQESEAESIGWVREVEGTEEQATVWYDARVIDSVQGAVERRFPSFEGAVAALAVRVYYEPDARAMTGW
jgi:hypothetical protein